MINEIVFVYDGIPYCVPYYYILIEVLFADDTDANISNGTPNDIAIIQAFALHGITLLSNAVITHTPVETAIANTSIAVNATITLTYPWALANANCYYRVNNSTIWTSLAMSITGNNMQDIKCN